MALADMVKPNVEKLKAGRDIEGLIRASRYGKDPCVRSEALLALGDIFDGRVVGALGEALNDGDARVRMDAVHALGKVPDPRAMEVLSGALKDGDPAIRSLAQKMLISHVHSLKVGPDVDGLVRAASSDDPYIRLNAVSALGEVGDERASEALVSLCLRDPYYPVRFEAAESLRKVNDKRAVDMLAEALLDKDPAIRLRAAEALGKAGDRRAVGALSSALKDDDEAVRNEAMASLGKIGDPRVMNMIVAAMKRKKS